MKVWIVTVYEPLPLNNKKTKAQRCGMLASALLERGHSVSLWTSAFDHALHKHYHERSILEESGPKISIQFIKGCGYRKDRSPKRFIHNRLTAREFVRLADACSQIPDIIFAPIPILELTEAAVQYARRRDIPIIVDIRDLWPDVYLTALPKYLRPVGKRLLHFEYQRVGNILRNATGITAISDTYLQYGLSYAQRSRSDMDEVFPLGSECSGTPNLAQPNQGDGTDLIKQKYGIDENHFVATYVGTFSRFLDVENILKAARLLIKHQGIRIFVIGTGERSHEFLRLAEHLPNVCMTGWLSADKIRSILQRSQLGLVAYSKDAVMSLPNKPFEYMAAGLPLLSSLPGELARLIQAHGIGRNYEAGNPKSMAGEVLWFYSHPEETALMGKRSSELFWTKFRSDMIYGDLSKHLERIVANREKNEE